MKDLVYDLTLAEDDTTQRHCNNKRKTTYSTKGVWNLPFDTPKPERPYRGICPASTFKPLIRLFDVYRKMSCFPSSNNRAGDIAAKQGNMKYSSDSLRLLTTNFLWRCGFRFLSCRNESRNPSESSLTSNVSYARL